MFSKQDTFDVAAKGMLLQGRRSTAFGRCFFRGPDGTRCAVGFLIPDELYDKRMDDYSSNIGLECAVRLGHNEGLCRDMMVVHDEVAVGRWREALAQVADKHNLSSKVLWHTKPEETALRRARDPLMMFGKLMKPDEFPSVSGYGAFLALSTHAPTNYAAKVYEDLVAKPAQQLWQDELDALLYTNVKGADKLVAHAHVDWTHKGQVLLTPAPKPTPVFVPSLWGKLKQHLVSESV